MPANLTQAELDRLKAMQALGGNSGWVPQFGVLDNGTQYQSMYDTSGAQGESAQTPSLTGYTVYQDGMTEPGMKYQEYGTDGTWQREGEFHDPKHNQLLMMALAAMGGIGFGLPALMGQGAGAAGSAAGFVGEGALSGVPAWDAALANAIPGELGAAGATFNAAKDSQLANAAIDAGGGNALSGYQAAGATPPIAGGGGGGSGLGGLGSLGSLGGLAATALGGLAGAQGQQANSTTTRDMPEWLKPYVLGNAQNPGVLSHVQGLLNRQMAPGALAGYDDMQSIGRNLMNRPLQTNGFSRFFPGK